MTEPKRPRGLKRSTEDANTEVTEKRPKQLGENEVEQEGNEETETLVFRGEGAEEVDDIKELRMIYESAVEKLGSSAPKSALSLLRGAIHECDRILRTQPENQRPPYIFYWVYASALQDLGELLEADGEESCIPYVDEALDRLERGAERLEEAEEGDKEEGWKLWLAFGNALMKKATQALKENNKKRSSKGKDKRRSDEEFAVQAVEKFEQASAERWESARNEVLMRAADLVQAFGDLREDWDGREKWNLWAISKYEIAIKPESNPLAAYTGLGSCYLSLANYWLEQIDSDEGEEGAEEKETNEEELTEEEKKAAGYLEKSVDYYKRALDIAKEKDCINSELLTMLSEALINLANLTLNDEEQTALYREAVTLLKQARGMGHTLPAQFEEFIEEWERELDEN
ncbi:uncharacterized protein VTP21DRAFT_5630 [Calcarisporiella thermophila]|uniref:uncharacterized protein n=1 Tax=Calcarisporiella thermophila TaxID=911321 RepID=UPI0037446D1D